MSLSANLSGPGYYSSIVLNLSHFFHTKISYQIIKQPWYWKQSQKSSIIDLECVWFYLLPSITVQCTGEFAFRNEPVQCALYQNYQIQASFMFAFELITLWPSFPIFSPKFMRFFSKKGKKGVVDTEIHTGAAPHHSFLLVLQILMHHLCTNRKKFSVKIPFSLGNSSFFCCSRAFQNLPSKNILFFPKKESL